MKRPATMQDKVLKHKAYQVLSKTSTIPLIGLRFSVHEGTISLYGRVENHYQKYCAEQRLKTLAGIKNINNCLRIVRSESRAHDIKAVLESRLLGYPDLLPHQVQVQVEDHMVKLSGRVKNFEQRKEVEEAALATAGIHTVLNELAIEP